VSSAYVNDVANFSEVSSDVRGIASVTPNVKDQPDVAGTANRR
jgi:hypothetical protein